jgi:hypothetical protein
VKSYLSSFQDFKSFSSSSVIEIQSSGKTLFSCIMFSFSLHFIPSVISLFFVGMVGIIAIVMRLLDRYDVLSHLLGIHFLSLSVNQMNGSQLLPFVEWILPKIFLSFKYVAAVSTVSAVPSNCSWFHFSFLSYFASCS